MLFSTIQGQEKVKSHLIKEIQSGKISHAKMFLGKSGYATLPLAIAYAGYLFCENRGQNDSCGACSSCKKVSELQHPDLHFSFPTVLSIAETSAKLLPQWREQVINQPVFSLYDWSNKIDQKGRTPIIGKDESQEIIKKLALKSYEGGFKVMIIWMAEEMNIACANKLLKILEEPSDKTIFILIVEDASKVLATIQSRTQLIRIPQFANYEIQQVLEQKGVGKQLAENIANRCGGDLNTANEILKEQHEEHQFRDLFVKLMRVCFKRNVIEMLDWSEEVAALHKEKQKQFTLYALFMIRQSMLKNYTQNMLVQASTEEIQFLENFSRFITNNNIYDFIQLFDDAYYHIDRNAAPKILFTQVCFQIMRYIHKS